MFSNKHQLFLLFVVNVKIKMKKWFKEKESTEILKILNLIESINKLI